MDGDAAQDQRRDRHQHGIDEQCERRADDLDQRTGDPWPRDLGARGRERVLRMSEGAVEEIKKVELDRAWGEERTGITEWAPL